MLQHVEQLSSTTRRLKINIPSDVIKSETESVYSKLGVTTKIPGFRPGKVPRAILEKRFGKNVEAEVIEKIVPEFYLKAIKEANLEPVSYPNIDERIEITPGQPLTFSVTVEVRPEIGELNYSGISLKEKPVEVSEDEVRKTLELMQESKALYSVTDEALKENDMAVISTDAFVDGTAQEELSYKDYPMLLTPDSMPREFTSALIGKKKGDTAEVTLDFEKDHPNKAIAGKNVFFKIHVMETKKKNLPPLDEDFAKEANCSDLEELKKKISDNIVSMKKGQTNLEYKKDILNELISRHEFDVPASMLEGEIDSLIHKAKEDAARKGGTLKSDEEMKKDFETTARDNVRSVILLDAIGKKENIQVSDDDIKNAVEEIAHRNQLKPEEVLRLYSVREGSMDALKSRLFADKVLEFILEKSTIQS